MVLLPGLVVGSSECYSNEESVDITYGSKSAIDFSNVVDESAYFWGEPLSKNNEEETAAFRMEDNNDDDDERVAAAAAAAAAYWEGEASQFPKEEKKGCTAAGAIIRTKSKSATRRLNKRADFCHGNDDADESAWDTSRTKHLFTKSLESTTTSATKSMKTSSTSTTAAAGGDDDDDTFFPQEVGSDWALSRIKYSLIRQEEGTRRRRPPPTYNEILRPMSVYNNYNCQSRDDISTDYYDESTTTWALSERTTGYSSSSSDIEESTFFMNTTSAEIADNTSCSTWSSGWSSMITKEEEDAPSTTTTTTILPNIGFFPIESDASLSRFNDWSELEQHSVFDDDDDDDDDVFTGVFTTDDDDNNSCSESDFSRNATESAHPLSSSYPQELLPPLLLRHFDDLSESTSSNSSSSGSSRSSSFHDGSTWSIPSSAENTFLPSFESEFFPHTDITTMVQTEPILGLHQISDADSTTTTTIGNYNQNTPEENALSASVSKSSCIIVPEDPGYTYTESIVIQDQSISGLVGNCRNEDDDDIAPEGSSTTSFDSTLYNDLRLFNTSDVKNDFCSVMEAVFSCSCLTSSSSITKDDNTKPMHALVSK